MYTEDGTVELDNGQEQLRWHIDSEWLEANKRSSFALARSSLCPKCLKRFDSGKPKSFDDILATVRDCCSKEPEFISGGLPIMESVFRIFLANGNQPLDLIELGRQLSEQRGVDTYRTSVEMLSRLLKRDEYYGIRPVKPDSEE